MNNMKTATVRLTAYNMADNTTQVEFDSFATLVAERIDELTGLDVTVEQYPLVGGPAEDSITIGDGTYFDGTYGRTDEGWAAYEEALATVRAALVTCWEEWCSS